jgi:hypothetical protein
MIQTNFWFILFNSMFKMFHLNFLDNHFEDSSISDGFNADKNNNSNIFENSESINLFCNFCFCDFSSI